jgi:hypothetical protein
MGNTYKILVRGLEGNRPTHICLENFKMKSYILQGITPSSSVKFNPRFEGTYRLYFQGRSVNQSTVWPKSQFDG